MTSLSYSIKTGQRWPDPTAEICQYLLHALDSWCMMSDCHHKLRLRRSSGSAPPACHHFSSLIGTVQACPRTSKHPLHWIYVHSPICSSWMFLKRSFDLPCSTHIPEAAGLYPNLSLGNCQEIPAWGLGNLLGKTAWIADVRCCALWPTCLSWMLPFVDDHRLATPKRPKRPKKS